MCQYYVTLPMLDDRAKQMYRDYIQKAQKLTYYDACSVKKPEKQWKSLVVQGVQQDL